MNIINLYKYVESLRQYQKCRPMIAKWDFFYYGPVTSKKKLQQTTVSSG